MNAESCTVKTLPELKKANSPRLGLRMRRRGRNSLPGIIPLLGRKSNFSCLPVYLKLSEIAVVQLYMLYQNRGLFKYHIFETSTFDEHHTITFTSSHLVYMLTQRQRLVCPTADTMDLIVATSTIK